MKTPPLTLLIDTSEQRFLDFPERYPIEFVSLGEGDYTARGLETDAIIERKSSADLLGTLTAGAEPFAKERARLRAYRNRAILIDDAWTPEQVIKRVGRPEADWYRLQHTLNLISWIDCIPVIWGGNRHHAALEVIRFLELTASRLSPAALELAEHVGLAAVPYASVAAAREAAWLSLSGKCVRCARELPRRLRPPEAPDPSRCCCGRKAA
jgi:hypothetical protein